MVSEYYFLKKCEMGDMYVFVRVKSGWIFLRYELNIFRIFFLGLMFMKIELLNKIFLNL